MPLPSLSLLRRPKNGGPVAETFLIGTVFVREKQDPLVRKADLVCCPKNYIHKRRLDKDQLCARILELERRLWEPMVSSKRPDTAMFNLSAYRSRRMLGCSP